MFKFKTIGAVSAVAVLCACGGSENAPEITEIAPEASTPKIEPEPVKAEARTAKKDIWDTAPVLSATTLRDIYRAENADRMSEKDFSQYAICIESMRTANYEFIKESKNEFSFPDYLKAESSKLEKRVSDIKTNAELDKRGHYLIRGNWSVQMGEYDFEAERFATEPFKNGELDWNTKSDPSCGDRPRFERRPEGWPVKFIFEIENANELTSIAIPKDRAQTLIENLPQRGSRERRANIEFLFALPSRSYEPSAYNRFDKSDVARVPVKIIEARIVEPSTDDIAGVYDLTSSAN